MSYSGVYKQALQYANETTQTRKQGDWNSDGNLGRCDDFTKCVLYEMMLDYEETKRKLNQALNRIQVLESKLSKTK